MSLDVARLERALAALPSRYDGPGGVAAVVHEGQVLVRQAWGYADLDRRIPWAPTTLAPICSISKQFTCALVLDRLGGFEALDADLAARLPGLKRPPRAADLANNQSGLRDYWALTVLSGARPEGEFRPEDARALIGRTTSTHFEPGTQYSYSNGNFRLLAEMLEERLGEPFGPALERHVLRPAGMATARLAPETSRLPGDAVGHEGDPAAGFMPAVNAIHWMGDAGMVACLDDMVAWEQHIDATREDEGSLYSRLSTPVTFRDGTPAGYGHGLARFERHGVAITGHGAGLRGWRGNRIHAASERLSVVVLFNHHADAGSAALDLMGAALGWPEPAAPAPDAFDESWGGAYLDRTSSQDGGTGLVLRLDAASGRWPDGKLTARFVTGAETLEVGPDDTALSPTPSALGSAPPAVELRREGDALLMRRPRENLSARLVRLTAPGQPDAAALAGRYWSEELGSAFRCELAGGVPHGGFDGSLGRGPMAPLHAMGRDADGEAVWRLPTRRSMDAPAPGDWTVLVHRDGSGRIEAVTIGCWLARQVRFERVVGY